MGPIACLLLLFGGSSGVLAAGEATYLNVNAWEAQKTTAGIISIDPKLLPTADERAEWVRARLAAIALARLQAKEDEAVKLFEGCGLTCEKYGRESEWQAVKAWGCQKKETLKCVSLRRKPKNPYINNHW